jgi:hypothetical protein
MVLLTATWQQSILLWFASSDDVKKETLNL